MRRRLAVLLLISFAASQTFAAQSTTPDPPKTVREALTEKWKGWRQSSPVVTADFNSDGRMDHALAVTISSGVRLVVVLNRLEDRTVVDVDALSAECASAPLSVQPVGTKFRRAGDAVDDYFSEATLVVGCAKP